MTDTLPRRLAEAALGLRHVFIRDLVLSGRIGVHRHEQEAAQRLCINLDLAVAEEADGLSRGPATRPAPAPGPATTPGSGADELSRVVCYEQLADAVRRIVAQGHVNLVETLAERIAEAALADPRVRLARVRVEKLDVFPDAFSAGVEIERRQG
ncbi:MAG: dihydroneopterin aldolase [Alphaproteobacteria bacterium]|nr:dihydroneopterin aldolase [Alphaproteobacteria bacterium]